jgi:hypothetical protein
VGGYEENLQIWLSPDDDDDDNRDTRTWLGKDYDPEHFDARAVNRALYRLGRAIDAEKLVKRQSRPGSGLMN